MSNNFNRCPIHFVEGASPPLVTGLFLSTWNFECWYFLWDASRTGCYDAYTSLGGGFTWSMTGCSMSTKLKTVHCKSMRETLTSHLSSSRHPLLVVWPPGACSKPLRPSSQLQPESNLRHIRRDKTVNPRNGDRSDWGVHGWMEDHHTSSSSWLRGEGSWWVISMRMTQQASAVDA